MTGSGERKDPEGFWLRGERPELLDMRQET